MESAELVAIRCPIHDVGMIQRLQSKQTRQQKFCGSWWDCPKCRCSILFQSRELRRELARQRHATKKRTRVGQVQCDACGDVVKAAAAVAGFECDFCLSCWRELQ